ncbi:hypothetical protein F4778DRAFT_779794 [Xylariomycetidae sp. FL2044]|nr:hypothetical protein F4778DRAFT_779794 [Xylariomycetidae sp. FL2044]
MSASRNPDSVAAKGEEFHNRVPPTAPLTTKGHKPGVKVGKDAVPEFHAETHPAGTAPPENTFEPNPTIEIPAQATSAEDFNINTADTLPGATSADVYKGLGKPMQGQTSSELHGKEKKERSGVEGRGASAGVDSVRQKGADLPEGVHKGMKGKWHPEYPAAEDRPPVRPEELASEADRKEHPERAFPSAKEGKP